MSPMTHKSITETQKGKEGEKKLHRCSDACPLVGSSQLRLGPVNEALSMQIRSGFCRVKMKFYLHKIEIRKKSVIIP